MGDTGPCGPSSELFFDKGPDYGDDGGPAFGGAERFVEIWNLVFMQYNRTADGTVEPLPRPSIDTGAGLERILPVLQGVDSIFDTDLFAPMIETAESLTGHATARTTGPTSALRILADHGRAMSMLVADGVLPANEGRGYVLRRIIRRAVRRARQLGVDRAITPAAGGQRGGHPGRGLPGAGRAASSDRRRRGPRGGGVPAHPGHRLDHPRGGAGRGGAGIVPGDLAFRLHDTYGFPVELTVEIAEEAGVAVDLEAFERGHGPPAHPGPGRGRRRAAPWPASRPTGRCSTPRARPCSWVSAPTATRRPPGWWPCWPTDPEHAGQAEIFLDRTPFYAEGGGQVGDTGTIVTETGTAVVYDTVSALPGLTSHRARVTGELFAGQDALATIDGVRRDAPPAQPHRHPPAPRRPADRCSATTCASRARWWPPTACASTSATTGPWPPRSWPRWPRWPTPTC